MKNDTVKKKRGLWQRQIVTVARQVGGSLEDELFLISLSLNVDPKTLPGNLRGAAKQLWRKHCPTPPAFR